MLLVFRYGVFGGERSFPPKFMLKSGVQVGEVGGAAGRRAAAGRGFTLAEDRATAGVNYFDNGYNVMTGNGGTLKVRNPRWQWAKGARGALGSIAGAGLIDGFFQLASDMLTSNLCLSPNQYFWRSFIAITFGIVAGAFGLAFGATAAAMFGVTGIALTAIAFTASLITTIALFPAKQDAIDSVTKWSG